MAKSKSETKSAARDLMEYILLISFVFLGSSYVLAREVQVAGGALKSPDTLRVRDVAKVTHLYVLFGHPTKRHVK